MYSMMLLMRGTTMGNSLSAKLVATAGIAFSLLASTLAPAQNLAGIPAGDPAALGFSAERLAVMDEAIETEIRNNQLAGVVVAVTRHGQLVQNKAYGYANRETGQPMTTDNLFRLYSMTKGIASVALLTLYEKGLFQLNEPLDKYIPQFSNLKVFTGYDSNGNMMLEDMKRKPTILDAFRHTLGMASGIGNSEVDKIYQQHGISFGSLDSLSEQMDKLGEVPLRYQPGEQWVYGVGHDVQAYLIEVFSGMSYAQYLQQAVFEPLQMHDTMFGVPAALKNRFATVYQPDGEGGIRPSQGDSYARFTDHHFATLSLSGSTGDYLKFSQMLLNKGELNGQRILGRKTVELMTQNLLPPEVGAINDSGSQGWGLGLSVNIDVGALGRLGSNGAYGWAGAAATYYTIDPVEDMVILIMAQHQPTNFDVRGKIENLVYQALVD
jgi:CubicO group peptidase (beta-lactamase class C family)